MCGRFTLTRQDLRELAEELGADLDPALVPLYRARFNAAPGDRHPVLRLDAGRRLLVAARFGFEGPKGSTLINARSETAARLPTFRVAFREGRCVVPTDGFYEWQGPKGARRPLWYHRPAKDLVLMAGLVRQAPSGLEFVILTTPANEAIRAVHDRMPAILSREEAAAWLDHPDAALLRPAPEDWLAARPVSQRVNAVANDDPGLLEPVEGARQLTLL